MSTFTFKSFFFSEFVMQCLYYLKICIFCFPTHKDYRKCHCMVTRDLPLNKQIIGHQMFLNIFSITVILNLEPKIISINENPQSDIKYQCYSSHFPNGFLHYTQMYFFLDLLLRFLEIFCTISFRSIQYSIAFIARHVLVIFFEYISSIISCRHYV